MSIKVEFAAALYTWLYNRFVNELMETGLTENQRAILSEAILRLKRIKHEPYKMLELMRERKFTLEDTFCIILNIVTNEVNVNIAHDWSTYY